MFSRTFRFAALALLLAVPTVWAQEAKKGDAPAKKEAAKPSGPAVLVRVQSVNDLLKTANYLVSLAPGDVGEQIKQGIAAAKDFIDPKTGLEGIGDPIGLYITFTEEMGPTPPVVLLIPVADEATLLKALEERLQLKVEKEKDGTYKVDVEQIGMPVYFRFANKYAYVTIMDSANIDPKTLPKPADVLGNAKSEHLLSASVRIDRLPEAMKATALLAIENQLAAGKQQALPGETKAIKALKDKAIDEVVTNLKAALDGGEEASLRFNVDPKSEEIAIELELKATKGSKLAKDIASIRENKSVVGGALAFPDAAFSINLSASLSSELKKLLPAAVDDIVTELKKQANVPGEFEKKAEPLINALLPTVKAGDIDLGVALVGPDKSDKYTGVVAMRVVGGKKIETAIKDLVKSELPPEYSAFFKLDAEKLSGGAMLHTIKLSEMKNADGKDALDENAVKVFGKNDLHLTFRDDLVIAAIGPGAKDALTKALESKPADVGVFQAQVSLSRIVPIVGDNAEQLAAMKKTAERIFGKAGSKADTIRFSIEGGDSLKVKLAAKGKALAFLIEAAGVSKDN